MIRMLQKGLDWLGLAKPVERTGDVVFVLRFHDLKIGELRFIGGEWIFAYSDDFRKQNAVAPLVDFPNVEKEHRSKHLWPFFALRVPSPEQTEVLDFLHSKNVESVDEVTMLREFGRRSISNPFDLVPA